MKTINYQETIDWMFTQLPMYQRQGKMAYKADLSNAVKLATHLENPEKAFKSIHVAGTNGKGSVSHMVASIFMEAGYKVGLYTSPHLKDFRERIKINGEVIDKRSVSSFITKHQDFFIKNQVSFFEMTVGLAFEYFKKQKVDIAIIEVGMGGRLDSTNIITPEISVITNIGLDHTQFLGTTLAEIAKEKAGIIKNEVPIVIGEYNEELEPIFETIARENKSPIHFAYEFNTIPLNCDLKGDYQKHNIKTVQTTVAALQTLGWAVGIQHIAKGLQNVVKNTGLFGRWQILQEKPKVICDTAHNKEGLKYVIAQLGKERFANLHIILGFVNDKDLDAILPLFPKQATYYFCKPNIPRGMEATTLQVKAKGFELKGAVYKSVTDAFKAAIKTADDKDFVFVGGSTFVVAEVV